MPNDFRIEDINLNDSIASRGNESSSYHDSLLDFSMQMQEDLFSKHVPSAVRSGSSTFRNHRDSFGNSVAHPARTPSPSSAPAASQRLSRDHISYIPDRKIEIWKWGFKFSGDYKSMTAREFLQRVAEHADTRGATSVDLFRGAVDLFEGIALKWFRAGRSNNLFRDWQHVETLAAASGPHYASMAFQNNM